MQGESSNSKLNPVYVKMGEITQPMPAVAFLELFNNEYTCVHVCVI